MNLTRTNWALGWTPDADNVNGDPNGLLRMDNLQLEEDGVLSLVRGISEIQTGLSGYISQLYSKIIGSNEYVYAALSSGSIVRGGLSGGLSEIASSNSRTGFGDCLGQVLIFSGQTRLKDTGSGTPKKLGLATPGTPSVEIYSQKYLNLEGGWTADEGQVDSQTTTGTFVTVDPTTVRANLDFSYSGDTTNIGGDGASKNIDKDVFEFQVTPDDSSVVTSVEIRFEIGNDAYYRFVWSGEDLSPGLQQTSMLSAKRGDFTDIRRVGPAGERRGSGGSSTAGWSSIQSIRIIVVQTSYTSINFDNLKFTGGALGQINGTYQWIQVNKANNSIYLATSPISQAVGPKTITNGYVKLTPGYCDDQVTDVYFFRRGTNLDEWYQVAATKPGAAVDDTMSDDEALEIDIIANPFLQTMRAGDANAEIDDIFGVEGIWNGRMLYMGIGYVFLSDFLNPDAVDTRYTIKAFGDPTERNLWVSRVSNNTYILGTSKNNYEISGTLEPLPDGTLDITVIPIGERYPSLTMDHALVPGGGILYMGADGPRVTRGSNSISVSPTIRLLFQGESRHGVPAVILATGDSHYGLGAGKTKIYVSVPTVDGSFRLLIYDTVKQTWRLQYTDPVTVHVTETDHVLLGYNQPNGLFELDVGQGISVQGGQIITGIPFTFETVFDANGQPRNRKDTFTLKVVCDTGGADVDIYLGKDLAAGTYVGSVNGSGTFHFPLTDFTLGFRYQLKMVDRSYVTTLKIYEITIEYDARPEQLDYLRILPNNLGTISRKRILNYAFVIDSLGHDIKFTPLVDNSNGGLSPSNSTVHTVNKLTYIHYFQSETIGTDIGGILSGGLFEFYGLALEEIVSEKMPTPAEYLVIPPNNYGTPNRKRHSSYKFQINTRGKDVTFTPILDTRSYPSHVYNTNVKQTVEYYFNSDTIGIDIGGILDSAGAGPFEFYGTVVPQQIEQLPDRLEFFLIPPSDYGKPNRKRHTSYKFQINTNGHDVVFTPILDGVSYTPTTFNTASKQTVEHFFTQLEGDVIGIDIGGTLSGAFPFEFYGTIVPQEVELLPARLEYFRIPNTNYGVASRKRIRTIPVVLDTNGRSVTFTPIVDGISFPISTFVSNGKTTLYHFFSTDSFGIDYGGILQCSSGPFEFYELGTPEDVETLPVPKKYDQIGPIHFDRIGKIFEFRVRLIALGTTTTIPFAIYGDSIVTDPTYAIPLYSSTFTVIPGVDNIYTIKIAKNINTNVFRMVLGPVNDYFHRYDLNIRVSESGMETDARWIRK